MSALPYDRHLESEHAHEHEDAHNHKLDHDRTDAHTTTYPNSHPPLPLATTTTTTTINQLHHDTQANGASQYPGQLYPAPTTASADQSSQYLPHQLDRQDTKATADPATAAPPLAAAPTSLPSAQPSHAAQFPPPTQEIPRNEDSPGNIDQNSAVWQAAREAVEKNIAPPDINPASPAWAAARESVLKSMGSENRDQDAAGRGANGRGRGRPRRGNFPNGDRSLPYVDTGAAPLSSFDQSVTTPIKRGRGGRPRRRGNSGRKKSRSSRKKGAGADGDLSDSDDLSDDSAHHKDPVVTKSGRSVNKPSQFNPVTEPSPVSGTKRKRSQQLKATEQIWCVKCSRGHSPPSNRIVLCDGCNAAYHQWCHDPLIEDPVVEDLLQVWFCGNCIHAKEVQNLPIERRVAGGNLSPEEKSAYLSLLPKPTLVSLLVHGTSLHPDLPVFAPNTREVLASIPKPNIPSPQNNGQFPASPASQSMHSQRTSSVMNHQNQAAVPSFQDQLAHPASNAGPMSPHNQPRGQDPAYQRDPYPEYSNEAGDPPATYPRPGRGPIKLQPTTHPEDFPWMVQDNYEVFSHLVDDGTGRLVPVQQRPEGWATGVPMATQNGSQQPPPPQPPPPQTPADYGHQVYNHPGHPPPPHMTYAGQMAPPHHHHPHQHPHSHPQFSNHMDMHQRPPSWSPQHGMPVGNPMPQHPGPSNHGAMAYCSPPMQ